MRIVDTPQVGRQVGNELERIARRALGAAAGGTLALALPLAFGLAALALGGTVARLTVGLANALVSPTVGMPRDRAGHRATRLALACAATVGAAAGAFFVTLLAPILTAGGCIAGAMMGPRIPLQLVGYMLVEVWRGNIEIIGPLPLGARHSAQPS